MGAATGALTGSVRVSAPAILKRSFTVVQALSLTLCCPSNGFHNLRRQAHDFLLFPVVELLLILWGVYVPEANIRTQDKPVPQ